MVSIIFISILAGIIYLFIRLNLDNSNLSKYILLDYRDNNDYYDILYKW